MAFPDLAVSSNDLVFHSEIALNETSSFSLTVSNEGTVDVSSDFYFIIQIVPSSNINQNYIFEYLWPASQSEFQIPASGPAGAGTATASFDFSFLYSYKSAPLIGDPLDPFPDIYDVLLQVNINSEGTRFINESLYYNNAVSAGTFEVSADTSVPPPGIPSFNDCKVVPPPFTPPPVIPGLCDKIQIWRNLSIGSGGTPNGGENVDDDDDWRFRVRPTGQTNFPCYNFGSEAIPPGLGLLHNLEKMCVWGEDDPGGTAVSIPSPITLEEWKLRFRFPWPSLEGGGGGGAVTQDPPQVACCCEKKTSYGVCTKVKCKPHLPDGSPPNCGDGLIWSHLPPESCYLCKTDNPGSANTGAPAPGTQVITGGGGVEIDERDPPPGGKAGGAVTEPGLCIWWSCDDGQCNGCTQHSVAGLSAKDCRALMATYTFAGLKSQCDKKCDPSPECDVCQRWKCVVKIVPSTPNWYCKCECVAVKLKGINCTTLPPGHYMSFSSCKFSCVDKCSSLSECTGTGGTLEGRSGLGIGSISPGLNTSKIGGINFGSQGLIKGIQDFTTFYPKENFNTAGVSRTNLDKNNAGLPFLTKPNIEQWEDGFFSSIFRGKRGSVKDLNKVPIVSQDSTSIPEGFFCKGWKCTEDKGCQYVFEANKNECLKLYASETDCNKVCASNKKSFSSFNQKDFSNKFNQNRLNLNLGKNERKICEGFKCVRHANWSNCVPIYDFCDTIRTKAGVFPSEALCQAECGVSSDKVYVERVSFVSTPKVSAKFVNLGIKKTSSSSVTPPSLPTVTPPGGFNY